MTDDTTTRRRFLAGSSAVLGTTLAGCTGSGDAPETATATESGAGTTAGSPTEETPAGATATEGPYTATLSPVGEVTFDAPPERIFSITPHHAGMVEALGKGDGLLSVFTPGYFEPILQGLSARLDGVDISWAGLYSAWNPSKERLYDMNADLHLADPANVLTMQAWNESDVADVRENVAPWFGNSLSDTYRDPPEAYAGQYRHYPLWEIFDRVATALDERARYGALADLHAGLIEAVEADRPPESERPTVGMILPSTSEDGTFWAYDPNARGFYAAHSRPMGAPDAFADMATGDANRLDYESLLEADPDVLLVLGGMADMHDMSAIRDRLRADPVASQVTAVQDRRIHAQATRHQGPIVNLFQLEMTAKQLYPDRFGAWPTYESGPYPEIPESERLLDYDRLASVVTGEFRA